MKVASSGNRFPEKQLVDKICRGDRDAFKQLFFEYYYDLYSFASGMVGSEARAKDVVQEVFFNLWKRREKWEVNSSLKAYLFQSVRNRALNSLQKQQRYVALKEELSKEDPAPGEEVDFSSKEKKMVDRIWTHVQQLSPRRRSVFILHRKHGLTYKEIAEVLDLTRKTVENHMGMALEDLRRKMNKEL